MPVIFLFFLLATTCQTQDLSVDELTLRDQITKARSSEERGDATGRLFAYLEKNNLLDARTQDANLSIKLLALWRMGSPIDVSAVRSMIKEIQHEIGEFPPAFFSETLLSRRKGWENERSKGVENPPGLPQQQTLIEDGVVKLGKQVLLSKEKYDAFMSLVPTNSPVKPGSYKSAVFQKDTLQIIILYVDSGFHYRGTMFLRDANANKILWQATLLGAGNQIAGTGAARPRKFFCAVTDKYVCVYGTGPAGNVFMELFDRQSGVRVHAFSSQNWHR